MSKILLPVLILIAIGVFGTVGFLAFQKNKDKVKSNPPPAAPVLAAVPPPDARFLEAGTTAEGVMFSVSSLRKKADQEVAATQFVGLWVPEPGWESEVVDVTEEAGGTAIRMYTTTGSGLHSGFHIVAVVQEEPDNLGFGNGDRATVQGRIDKVEVLDGSVTPMPRILLKPARVLSFQKFR